VESNAHAGQGPVLLDIGGDVGAVVVTAPAGLVGAEIEARPVGVPLPGHLPHVGVVARPAPDGSVVPSAVFGALPAGTWDLYERPAGPVRLSVAVTGGAVTEAVWPA
jgi:hypothetical protein